MIPLILTSVRTITLSEQDKNAVDGLENLVDENTVLTNTEFLIKLGNCRYLLGDYSGALSCFLAAKEQVSLRHIRETAPEGAGEKGPTHPEVARSSDADLDRALEHDRESLRLHREIGFKYGQADSLGKIGDAHAGRGAVSLAIGAYEEALAIHRKIGDHLGEADDLINIAMTHKSAQDNRKALAYLEEALEVLEWHNLSSGKDRITREIDEIKGAGK